MRRYQKSRSKEQVTSTIIADHRVGLHLRQSHMERRHPGLPYAATKHFGSYRQAVEAAGVDCGGVAEYTKWNKALIVEKIRQFHRAGKDLRSGSLRNDPSGLHRACKYHFGSYGKAVEAAGIDYKEVRGPGFGFWTKPKLVAELQDLKHRGQDFHYTMMLRKHGALKSACVLHFGSYHAALHAAGIEYSSGNRRLSKEDVISAILADDRAGSEMQGRQIFARHRCLNAAVLRHFGSYRKAIEAAGLDWPPKKPLPFWTRPKVIKTLSRLHGEGVDLRDDKFKVTHQPLFAAAKYYYGEYHRAVEAAGISYRAMLAAYAVRR